MPDHEQFESHFLEGHRAFLLEVLRLFPMALEFLRGFWMLKGLGPAVTVFGSARFQSDHPYYKQAVEIGAALARHRLAVITGAGPGLMEAANRGAFDAKGRSIGFNVILPYEQTPNAFVERAVTFNYFFVRKIMLLKYSSAFVILPGGTGTLDELSEAVTLIQAGKLHHFPVILVGRDYWKGLFEWLRNTVIAQGALRNEDLRFVHFAESPEEIVELIEKYRRPQGHSASLQKS